MGNAIERWRQVRADRRDERARPWLNGGAWCVLVKPGWNSWGYRPATLPELVAYGIVRPVLDEVEAIVAGPAPVRLALVRGDAA